MNELRQSVAEDLAYLVETFRHHELPGIRAAYQMMVKVFEQQYEVVAERAAVRKYLGGEIICNSSDPEATLDGHKGSGYQVQLSETCGADNEVQLIVSAVSENRLRDRFRRTCRSHRRLESERIFSLPSC